jgi:hypothetical protein
VFDEKMSEMMLLCKSAFLLSLSSGTVTARRVANPESNQLEKTAMRTVAKQPIYTPLVQMIIVRTD